MRRTEEGRSVLADAMAHGGHFVEHELLTACRDLALALPTRIQHQLEFLQFLIGLGHRIPSMCEFDRQGLQRGRQLVSPLAYCRGVGREAGNRRSEEHTYELQSLMST